MDENKGIQPIPIVYNQASISLPLDEDAFKEFMVSLLGQPESIESYIEGAFEIDIGNFEYLNNLIDDRIAKQNLSSLLEFRAKLFFNDGSSMSFNGVQNFISYKELRPLVCEGFVFTWSYLVKFHNKQASEKQEISISSTDDPKTQKSKNNSKKNKSIFSRFDIISSHQMPRVNYSVRCTDKGWGIEITELVRKCLSSFTKTNSSLGSALRQKIVENFNLVKFACLVLFYLAFCMWMLQLFEAGMQECRNLSGQRSQYTKGTISINQKMDFLIQIISACSSQNSPSESFIIPLFSLFAGYLLLPPLIYSVIKLPNYRFLLFTEASKKERDKYFRQMNDRKTFWVITVLIGLIIGILGNYIFTWLTTILR